LFRRRAFLRAINVGSNTIIKMSDLKGMFESSGLDHMQVHIHSNQFVEKVPGLPATTAI
jgi:uncharacterized protein (DUF1697 family)